MKRISYAVLGLLASTAAHATTYTITNVRATYADNSGIVNVPGFGNPWTTPLELIDGATHQTWFTFCDDLGHDVTISAGQNLTYRLGYVKTDSEGRPISESISNMMGQLTTIGLDAASEGNSTLAVASQAVIWDIEEGRGASSPNHAVEVDIQILLNSLHDDGTGWAMGLISLSGTQSQILPSFIPPPLSTPEPSTWAMMLIGFIGLGFASRQTIKQRIS